MKKTLALILTAALFILTACQNGTHSETTEATTSVSKEENTSTETTLTTTTTTIETSAVSTYPPATVPTLEWTTAQTTTTGPITPVIPEDASKELVFITYGNGTCYLDRRGDCTDTEIKIPPYSPAGDRVIHINENAFRGDTDLISVSIPESVITIGASAFADCTSLVSVQFENEPTTLPTAIFRGCVSLSDITLPESLTEIGDQAFYGCTSLQTVGFPSRLARIGNSAYEKCTLKYLNFPSSLISIGDRAFHSCSMLIHVGFSEGLVSIGTEAFYNCLTMKEVVLPSTLRSVGKDAFNFQNLNIFTLYEHAYYLPSATNPHFLLVKSDSPFVQSFVIHPDTELIAGEAFLGCSLPESLNLPHAIRGIGDRAFALCTHLEEIYLDNSLEYIGKQAFLNCPIQNLIIPFNVRLIDERAFEHGEMQKITLNSGERLGDMAFAFSAAQTITLTPRTKNLPYRLFYGASYMHEIRFLGTIEQWNALSKDENWDSGMGGKTPEGLPLDTYTVHCTDGDIILPVNHN